MSGWVPFSKARAAAQEAFYASRGVTAFGVGAVPWRLSTGRAMAEVVRGAAVSWAKSQGKARVKLVDLGAGTGRLGFHLACLGLDVTLCEYAASMPEAWRANSQLEGLAFFTVNALEASTMEAALRVEPDQALVIIGTYLFDTLEHELVRVEAGKVLRGGELDGSLVFRADADAPKVTREGTYFAPVGALRCIEAVERAAQGPALFVFADKGPLVWERAQEAERLRVAEHHGAWSVAVNFPLLQEWTAPRRWHLHEDNVDDFVVGAIELGTTGAVEFSAPHPLVSQQAVTSARELGSEAAILALPADADALLELSDALRALAPNASNEVLAWVERAANEAFLVVNDDVAFHAATILHRASRLGDAEAWYSVSLARAGMHPTTLFNRALCRLQLGMSAEARADLEAVLTLEPNHRGATALLAELQ